MNAIPIPSAAISQHTIVLGKTRSGKSSVMRLMVEGMLDQHRPICVIDPKGDWWGLKSSSTGKSDGYPVIIFGGEHADLLLNSHAGAHVAELVATGNRPCVIDLGGWTVRDRTRFFIDFASTLFRFTRAPRVLVIDEVHNFAPQGKIMDPEAGQMLHWANRLASEGSGKGITLISASQRPQKVHKDFVTSNETLIAMRAIHPLDRRAVEDWISGCPDAEKGKEVLSSLASMPRGEGWVWSPEIGFGPKRVKFPLFSTYDSFAAPTGEATIKLKGWASVDLDDVKQKLAAVVEEAKANDPKLLKAEIAQLRRQMANAAKQTVATGHALDSELIAKAEEAGYERAKKELAAAAEHELQQTKTGLLEKLNGAIESLIAIMNDELHASRTQPNLKAQLTFTPTPIARSSLRLAPSIPPRSLSRAKPVARNGGGGDDERPLGAERRPLAVLAGVQPAGMTEAQWAVGAGLRRTGGTWSTYVSRLRIAGRIAKQGDLYFITDQGLIDLGGDVEPPPPPGPGLVEYWASRISGASPMLRKLAGYYPEWLSREQLAEELDLAASGGTFSTYLSRLRTPGLIEVRGEAVRAAPQLMEMT